MFPVRSLSVLPADRSVLAYWLRAATGRALGSHARVKGVLTWGQGLKDWGAGFILFYVHRLYIPKISTKVSLMLC
jgi:hypothetical protein